MEKITTNEIKYARMHRYCPITQVDFITEVTIKLMANVPESEIMKYPITTSRDDYFAAAQKICDMFNCNKIKKVFLISTFKGLNTLHKKFMLAEQKAKAKASKNICNPAIFIQSKQ